MNALLSLWEGMTGVVLPYAGNEAPEDWLLCYGQAVDRTQYQNLFSVIGTTFGTGDGSTTFNVPDMRGRVAAGKDDMGGTAAGILVSSVNGTVLGAKGGSETHALTTAEMPAHTHANVLSDPGHAHSNSLNDPGHAHSGQTWNAGGSTGYQGGGTWSGYYAFQPTNIGASGTGMSINNARANTGMSITNASQGSGAAHAITQPTIVLNHIIKI